MKKLATVLLTVIIFAGFTSAQNKMYLGVGPLISLPMGDFGDANDLGFGGTAAFEMEFMPQLIGTAHAGYITWGGKEAESNQGGVVASAGYDISAVPVVVGAKYFFMPDMGLYGAAQLGFYFMSFDYEVQTNVPGFNFDGSTSSTEFAFKIGAGYEIPLSPDFNIDLSAAFVIISDWTNIEIRAGGKFPL